MFYKVLQTLLVYVLMYVLAFDDIFVNGHNSQEIMEQGRMQYQLLREKGNLPRYGTCWKGVIDHVEDGCRNLSEDTQSDMALHITNCFLEMSGHETYNCELNKKPNLRSICINSMSDRAFNVYTEFYTHVQNICWFLRGQIWYETISENSLKVGKQLELSAKNQEELLEFQKESMELQQKILKHEKMLEGVLEDLYISTKAHQEVIRVLTKSVGRFQAWVIGEISLVESVLFYVICGMSVLILTSVKYSSNARLPLLLLLVINFLFERFINFILLSEDFILDTKLLHQNIHSYIWYCRYISILIMIFYLLYHSYHYKDIAVENNKFLQFIKVQNTKILEKLYALGDNFRHSPSNDKFDFVNESIHCNDSFRKTEIDVNERSAESIKGRRTYLKRSNYPSVLNGHYSLRSSKQNTPNIK